MKKVLVLCTGNSCRSIMAEALINYDLGKWGVEAYSSGVAPSGKVNPQAVLALEKIAVPTDGLHSKRLEVFEGIVFDLVVTVCDHAYETCPMFPGKSKIIHVGFEDPSGGEFEGYCVTRDLIRQELIPVVRDELGV